jgi:transposase
MAYSIDFIKRAVAYRQEGHTLKQLQEAFGIPAETYYDWKEKLENGFDFGVKAKGERKRKIDKAALKQVVEENPDAFLWELGKKFNCTPVAIFYALEKMDITLKKRPLPIPKNQKKNGLSLPKN